MRSFNNSLLNFFQDSDEDSSAKYESREPMESPFPEKLSSRSNVASEKVGALVKDRLATDSAERSNPRGNRPSRNEKGDAPPPDPGYKYVFSMSFLPLF